MMKSAASEQPVAIVTGGSRGIGLEIARELVGSLGMKVVVVDIVESQIKQLTETFGPGAENIDGRVLDVTDSQGFTKLVDDIAEQYGRLDVMVNNAVIDNPGGMLEDVEVADWEDGIRCHMTAPLLFAKEVVPHMIGQGGGSIINVSSSNALFGDTGISSYGPAKAGMINFTKALAVTYGSQGIRANALVPARMLTEKKQEMRKYVPAETRRQRIVYPLGGPATPEQMAEVMLFLASDESAAVTGHALVADRGMSAFNPISIPGRLEADIRATLESQGSDWIQGES